MQDQEEYSFNQDQSSGRTSMNKNYRVGKIKFFAKPMMVLDRQIAAAVLLNIIEWCGVRWSSYNLWITADDKFNVTPENVGGWAEVGFFIKGAYRDRVNGETSTELKMRHFSPISDEGLRIDITIGDPDNIKEEDMMLVPASVINIARAIYEGTQYEPVRTENNLNLE